MICEPWIHFQRWRSHRRYTSNMCDFKKHILTHVSTVLNRYPYLLATIFKYDLTFSLLAGFSQPFIHLILVKLLKLEAWIREIFWGLVMVYTCLTSECLSTTILSIQLPSFHARKSSHFIYVHTCIYMCIYRRKDNRITHVLMPKMVPLDLIIMEQLEKIWMIGNSTN